MRVEEFLEWLETWPTEIASLMEDDTVTPKNIIEIATELRILAKLPKRNYILK